MRNYHPFLYPPLSVGIHHARHLACYSDQEITYWEVDIILVRRGLLGEIIENVVIIEQQESPDCCRKVVSFVGVEHPEGQSSMALRDQHQVAQQLFYEALAQQDLLDMASLENVNGLTGLIAGLPYANQARVLSAFIYFRGIEGLINVGYYSDEGQWVNETIDPKTRGWMDIARFEEPATMLIKYI